MLSYPVLPSEIFLRVLVKVTVHVLAAGCQLFYRKFYGFFFVKVPLFYRKINGCFFLQRMIKWMNVLPEDQELIPTEERGKMKIPDKRHLNVYPP